MNSKQLIKVLPQYLLPQHLLSNLLSKLTHSENHFIKNLFIKLIIRVYKVNMQEAKLMDLADYVSFNQFFTRELKAGLRPIAKQSNAIVSPADGQISQLGSILDDRIFQAKNHNFSVAELLGGDNQLAENFANGNFATIYLSPKDYHRLHMPIAGRLIKMIHIPGRLFSVNTTTTNTVPNLFARNERVVCVFETKIGLMALVLVGAIFVSSIETVWQGVVTPPTTKCIRNWDYANDNIELDKGDEMGRFNMGSTIIVLFSRDKVEWETHINSGNEIKLGEILGKSNNI